MLFRAAHHSDLLEVELARRNIPFVKYGGLKFLEAGHVKDTLAILRVLENPWRRGGVVPRPATARGHGTGHRSATDDSDRRRATGTPDEASPLVKVLDQPVDVPRAAVEGFQELRSALRGCVDETVLHPAAQLERLRTFLDDVIGRTYAAAAARTTRPRPTHAAGPGVRDPGAVPVRAHAWIPRRPPAISPGPPLLDEDYLVLSTIHSAKGPRMGRRAPDPRRRRHDPQSDMATGDDDEIEEERRLLYVALTRARDALHVTFPMRYYRRPERARGPAQLLRSSAGSSNPSRWRRASNRSLRTSTLRPMPSSTSRAPPTSTRSSPASGPSEAPVGWSPCPPSTPSCSICTTPWSGATGVAGNTRSPSGSGSRPRSWARCSRHASGPEQGRERRRRRRPGVGHRGGGARPRPRPRDRAHRAGGGDAARPRAPLRRFAGRGARTPFAWGEDRAREQLLVQHRADRRATRAWRTSSTP